MNFLAHLYLAREKEGWMVGNFIADEVKGKKFADYPSEVSEGILMHRAIDSFTDASDIVHHSKRFFRKKYQLYSGVLIDLFYDHFLAKNWKRFSELPLEDFVSKVYELMHRNQTILPVSIDHMLVYMERDNWLVHYATLPGIQRSLNGLSRRIVNNPGIENSLAELNEHYTAIEMDFFSFFPQIQKFLEQKFHLQK